MKEKISELILQNKIAVGQVIQIAGKRYKVLSVEKKTFSADTGVEYTGDAVLREVDKAIATCYICKEDVDVTSQECASGRGRRPVHKTCVVEKKEEENNDKA